MSLTEWRIPVGRIEEFNSYIDHGATKWWNAHAGFFWLD
jgi:hypothetical protein